MVFIRTTLKSETPKKVHLYLAPGTMYRILGVIQVDSVSVKVTVSHL